MPPHPRIAQGIREPPVEPEAVSDFLPVDGPVQVARIIRVLARDGVHLRRALANLPAIFPNSYAK